MSATGAGVQVNERLAALVAAGTSPWLDQIRRSLIEGGELKRLIEEDSLRGVTSNPAIFEKAILGSDDYDDVIRDAANRGLDSHAIYEEIALTDVQMAADVMRPVWDESGGADGFVSLEVEPSLAHDTEGTLGSARDLWQRLERPNVMIKIPGTDAGVPAIETAISEGINVNVTLLFSVESYERVMEAFIRGMERRREAGGELNVHSVASFFVSRVDSEVDKRLADLGRDDLAGTAALANARAAYQRFKEIFLGDRYAELRDAGAPLQRPLWASTGVKNPHYPETMYVDGLVAPHTVNTMPMPTLLASAETAEIAGATADQDPAPALKALEEAGIDMDDVTDKLLRDGIDAFITPFEKLLDGIELVREAVITGRPPTVRSSIPADLEPALAEVAKRAISEDVARRIWKKDESLWGGPGVPEIGNRLGWLTISEPMLEHAPDLRRFADECAADGLTDAVLLGMGGSSLAPEVIRRSYGEIPGALRLHVLDSTDAAAIRSVEERIELDKTLFVVSTKSGGTVETISLFKHFHALVKDAIGDEAGGRFVAITDPGSSLVDLADGHGFRRLFLNDPDIGGRYSALSYFGLVPAALMGVDIEALLHRAQVAEQNCTGYDSTHSNSGLWLGIAMGAAALEGRDKLTFVVSEPIASFGLWVEQLIAESTGKEGKGILPVADEPLGEPESYGNDRVFAYLRNADAPDAELDAKMDALAKADQPVITVSVHGPSDLGRIFFFAEFATAVAGWVLGINPFDQPNVQSAKDATNRVLDGYRAEGALPEAESASDDALRELIGAAGPGRYVATMGYVEPSDAFDRAMAELRAVIRDGRRATTTFGYGPRFLHSTGQLHKGGPPSGIFLQLVHDAAEDMEIPGEDFSFTVLKNAQAIGDLETLRSSGRPAEQVRLGGDDAAAALRELVARVKGLL